MDVKPKYPKRKTCNCHGREEPEWSWEDDGWNCMGGCGMVLNESGKKIKNGKCCYECYCDPDSKNRCGHCRKMRD